MQVDAQAFWRAVKNASLFTKAKTWNGGEARFDFYGGVGTVTASDDFVTVVTYIPVDYDDKPPVVRYIGAKQLKEVESSLREVTGDTDLQVDKMASEASEPDWWAGLDDVIEQLGDTSELLVSSWELNPERLTLLSRLEPKGEYPLSWQAMEVGDDWLWGLKYGPHTFGLVVPLSRDDLDLDEQCLWHRTP